MENKKIDKLVEASLNPYLILKLELNHTKEDIESKLAKANDNFRKDYEANAIEIETAFNTTFIFLKESYYLQFISEIKEMGFDFNLKNATNEIFNMKDISIFNKLTDEDPNPEFTKQYFPDMVSKKDQIMEILKMDFSKRYNIDNILDKIGKDGIESLNELHKYILNNN